MGREGGEAAVWGATWRAKELCGVEWGRVGCGVE